MRTQWSTNSPLTPHEQKRGIDSAMDAEPVTIVISRVVRSGHEAAFEQKVREWIPRSIQFPGHLGALLLHPPADGQEYGAVLRFQSLEAWNAFRCLPEYRDFLREIRPHLVEDPHVNAVTGLEAWFRSNGPVPPQWKMAIVTWVGVCLTVGVVGIVMGPFMSGWTWFAQLLIMNAVVVALLTWVVMPVITRISLSWLSSRTATSKAISRTE
jgi:antibiotic biosynthesis monooxygenase (ABM) superfamily enzyme